MSGLTPEVLAILAKPFALEDHELRAGGRSGMLAYVTEEPLIDRLTEADPNWAFKIVSFEYTDFGGDKPDFAVAHGELTICGVTRSNVGYNDAGMKDYEWKDKQKVYFDKPIANPLTHTQIKGAPTDALKRCARLFGVGAYLLRLKGTKINNERDFAAWYARTFTAKPAASAPPTSLAGDAVEPPEENDVAYDNEPHTPPQDVGEQWDKDRVRNMLAYAQDKLWKSAGMDAATGAHGYERIAVALKFRTPNGSPIKLAQTLTRENMNTLTATTMLKAHAAAFEANRAAKPDAEGS